MNSLSIYENMLKELINDTTNDNETEYCLISNEPLNETHIKLKCGHKFNYDCILNEIKIQKIKNRLEIQKLKSTQIKCPYCRNIQDSLLPYLMGFPKINNINYPLKLTYKPDFCKYVFKSGKQKNNECGKSCYGITCIHHQKILNKKKDAKKEGETKEGETKEGETKEGEIIEEPKENKKIKNTFVLSEINTEQNKKIPTEELNYSYYSQPICYKLSKSPGRIFFKHRCQYIFKKGKNINKQCTVEMKCFKYDKKYNINIPIFYENVYCKKHSKGKKIVEIKTPPFIKKFNLIVDIKNKNKYYNYFKSKKYTLKNDGWYLN